MNTNGDERREGRGRLSSIEMLPEECDEDIAWARSALRAAKMTQVAILAEFNSRLQARGVPRISVGTFSRWSVRICAQKRKREDMAEALSAAGIDSGFDPARPITGVVAMQKQVLMELLLSDNLDHRRIAKAARALVASLKEAE